MLARSAKAGVGLARGLSVRHKISVPVPAVDASGAGGARRRRLKPKMPKDKFAGLATTFLDRVEAAMQPLAPPQNEGFEVERRTGADADNSGMTIRTRDATFELVVVPAKQQISLTTPVSGKREYEWNARTQRWEDATDSHDVEGLLTRDVMRFCSGIPSF